jgi:membrane-associated phospholipid phosphatase
MRIKHALACRRPIDYSPQVQPIIPTPRHGSLPSGHATESFIFAYVLRSLLFAARAVNPVYADDSVRLQLMRQAQRIAVNRTVAGVHFPVDSAAGAALGLTLAQYFVARCGAATAYPAWRFEGTTYFDRPGAGGDFDFHWQEIHNIVTPPGSALPPTHYLKPLGNQTADVSPLLKWLWDEALEEWTR